MPTSSHSQPPRTARVGGGGPWLASTLLMPARSSLMPIGIIRARARAKGSPGCWPTSDASVDCSIESMKACHGIEKQRVGVDSGGVDWVGRGARQRARWGSGSYQRLLLVRTQRYRRREARRLRRLHGVDLLEGLPCAACVGVIRVLCFGEGRGADSRW